MLNIWIPKELLLPEQRLNPVIIHLSPPETNPELIFWNQLREQLDKTVRVHYFHHLEEAGALIAVPNTLAVYRVAGNLAAVYEFRRKALAAGRTVITSDVGVELAPLPGEVVFATSTYRSSQANSIATPNWLFDLGSKISPIEKPAVPTVGFVGDTKYSGRLSNMVGLLPLPNFAISFLGTNATLNRSLPINARQAIAHVVRTAAVNSVRQAQGLNSSLIERTGGYFNASPEDRQKQREEYLQNLQDNAYHVCVRGDRNSSYRLYEVMSAGRIPVIIDTNLDLPMLQGMKWEDFSIIIPFSKIDSVGERIHTFHERLSDEDFEKICNQSQLAFQSLLPHKFVINTLRQKFGVLM
jgi:hypothetical protein